MMFIGQGSVVSSLKLLALACSAESKANDAGPFKCFPPMQFKENEVATCNGARNV